MLNKLIFDYTFTHNKISYTLISRFKTKALYKSNGLSLNHHLISAIITENDDTYISFDDEKLIYGIIKARKMFDSFDGDLGFDENQNNNVLYEIHGLKFYSYDEFTIKDIATLNNKNYANIYNTLKKKNMFETHLECVGEIKSGRSRPTKKYKLSLTA